MRSLQGRNNFDQFTKNKNENERKHKKDIFPYPPFLMNRKKSFKTKTNCFNIPQES